MPKPRFWIWIPVLFFAAGDALSAEDLWFRSNAAGMSLERSLSRAAALRNKYALSISSPEASEVPEYLREYQAPSFRIELHVLYEDGAESRRQWIFRDERGVTRLVSSGDPPPKPPEGDEVPGDEGEAVAEEAEVSSPEEEAESGRGSFFIEIYDENNLITEERQFSEETAEYITRYFYRDMLLIRAETHLHQDDAIEALTTDYYRYSRSKSLRAVERIYHQPLPEDNYQVRLSFPHLILNAAMDTNFVNPGTAYGSEFPDMPAAEGDQVQYTTDERGRVLVETTLDEEGELIGEIRNTWSGDRLSMVEWKSFGEESGEVRGEERRSEYEYDQEGDRIAERNYRNGILERVVRREGGREVEELYMNGEMILRAIWEEGRKISEEYFNLRRREENW